MLRRGLVRGAWNGHFSYIISVALHSKMQTRTFSHFLFFRGKPGSSITLRISSSLSGAPRPLMAHCLRGRSSVDACLWCFASFGLFERCSRSHGADSVNFSADYVKSQNWVYLGKRGGVGVFHK